MKYFIPEWDDRVDSDYDFINDTHSQKHKSNPVENGAYLWDVFGLSNVPIDGVLVSRVTIMENKRKHERALREGIHNTLRLPKNFEIMGDCGAFGYVKEKIPPYDPIETLRYYRDLGFNYGISVDHLVVSQFYHDRDFRMNITFENAIKSFDEWQRNFKNDFQLVVAVQGWSVQDYLKMYENFIKHSIRHMGFGGLARSPTTFIVDLIDDLVVEMRESRILPEYLHFFGLARPSLFPKFRELEEMGVRVGFDSASYLRKAWLSGPSMELNYLTLQGKGYAAIRVPIGSRKSVKHKEYYQERTNAEKLQHLEQECLSKLHQYDRGDATVSEAISVLSSLTEAFGIDHDIIRYYRRTLQDKPWKQCDCPLCRSLGIDIVIFRGNNRNRRRGFHNTYVFFQILKNPDLWQKFIKGKEIEKPLDLSTLEKGERVLVITGCTKEKQGYDYSTKTLAKEMYEGRLFQIVKKYCEAMGFDYVIISAKYGLVFPNDEIEGYEKILRTKEDIRNIQSQVEEKLKPLLHNYDRIVVIAGKAYRDVLENIWDKRFFVIKSKGYGDLCRLVKKSIPEPLTLLEFT